MHEQGIEVRDWQIRDRSTPTGSRRGTSGSSPTLTPYPYRFHLEQHKLTPIIYGLLQLNRWPRCDSARACAA